MNDHGAPELQTRLKSLLKPLASPRLTVVLLALSVILVFAGTIAQVNQGIWDVMHEYFRSPLVFIPLQNFFPGETSLSLKVPFPGGYTIGLLMLINLIAAHVARFKIKARGPRLYAGAAMVLLGAALIIWFHNGPLPGEILSSAGGYAGVLPLMFVGAGFYSPLVIGCALAFGKRGGIVLVHAALILLLIGEGVTSATAVETQMPIYEGAVSDWAQDIREVELAIIDPTSPDSDLTVAIPESRLIRAASDGMPIVHPVLPFSIIVERYYPNSELTVMRPGARPSDALANRGFGISTSAVSLPKVSGVDITRNINVPAAYVTFMRDGASVGTYLVSPNLQTDSYVIAEQEVDGGDRLYRIALRFRRYHKPYSLRLDEFHHDVYPGTTIPRNFSSDLHLVDTERGVDQDVVVHMNNPLRFAGDTLFQSSWIPGARDGAPDRGTILMVVRNPGWTIPYVACAMGTIGLFYQFGIGLTGFLRRRSS